MSYPEALEAAGFTVHAYKQFGSWSGRWAAHVTDPDGVCGIIEDWYGSCSVCDAFEADVGWEPWENPGDPEYEQEITEYREKVRMFGTRYYGTVMTGDVLRAFITYCEEDKWDDEKNEMAVWIKSQL